MKPAPASVRSLLQVTVPALILLTILIGPRIISAQDGAAASSQSGTAGRFLPHLGSEQKVQQLYERWRVLHDERGGDRNVILSLGPTGKHASVSWTTNGRATLDLLEGAVRVEVRGLPAGEEVDVWLVDNRPGETRSAMPEQGDGFIRLGSMSRVDGRQVLQASVEALVAEDFEADHVLVTPHGGSPLDGSLLSGTPSLFQRMYTQRRLEDEAAATDSLLSAEGENVPVTPVMLRGRRGFQSLIDQGEDLFFNETFAGNGRTCGTCHPAENNLTIDPAFIATLPDDDPLFVAEFIPALSENFENPALMRAFGLIMENVDGMEDLEHKFTMRGVPHTLALPTSITPSTIDGSRGGDEPPFERTGWSGDGAPGGGTLREFAMGAVNQHYPLTLNREPGVDFLFPTDEQLDALEAFLLSLGRQEDPDLSAMQFRDPDVRSGRDLFNGAAKCARCHFNAGANISFGEPAGTQNANFDIGVENEPHPADLLDEPRPRDGGFGLALNDDGGFGDGRFNTPSLIEAADTPPFYHNNLMTTIEEAVAFYNGAAFNASPAGQAMGGISLTDNQVNQVAALLRVLNALESIRSATSSVATTLQLSSRHDDATLAVAAAEIEDGVEVLSDVDLHPLAVMALQAAASRVEDAKLFGGAPRAMNLSLAVFWLKVARALMVEPPG